MTTPEEIIVMKLRWHKMGGGDRHLRDIAGVIKVLKGRLDVDYIEQNARALHVFSLWEELLQRVGKVSGEY